MKKTLCILAFLFAATLLRTQISQAGVIYDFHQTGYDEGAYVTGMFEGVDNNTNGQLSGFDGEILDFGMTFSGNSSVVAFSLGFSDLFGVVWDIGSPLLGDGITGHIEGIAAGYAGPLGYMAGAGPLVSVVPPHGVVWGPAGTTMTNNHVVMGRYSGDPIPEPTTMALLGIGLVGLVGGAARKKWKKKEVEKS